MHWTTQTIPVSFLFPSGRRPPWGTNSFFQPAPAPVLDHHRSLPIPAVGVHCCSRLSLCYFSSCGLDRGSSCGSQVSSAAPLVLCAEILTMALAKRRAPRTRTRRNKRAHRKTMRDHERQSDTTGDQRLLETTRDTARPEETMRCNYSGPFPQ